MNWRDYFTVGLVFIFSSFTSSAQVSDGNALAEIFGEPFRNPCFVSRNSGSVRLCRYYNFNADYQVGVEANKDGGILKVYLIPKGDEVSCPISPEDTRKFLNKVERIRQFGPLRFTGRTSMPWGLDADVWEIRENAYIAYGHKSLDKTGSALTAILVYFPFEITGNVSSVENFFVGSKNNKLSKIVVDGARYLSIETEIKSESINTVVVVNP